MAVEVGQWDDGDVLAVSGVPCAADVPGRRRLADPAVGAPVAHALSGDVGAELLGRLVDLVCASAEPTGRLSAREWVEATVTASAMLGYCEALRLTCVRELDRALDPSGSRSRSAPPGRRAADELAPALGIAPRTASSLVNLARRVQDDLPAAADALADGRLTLTQVRVLEQVTDQLPAGLSGAVEAVAVRHGARDTASQLRVRLQDEAARLDPAYTAREAARGVQQRDVSLARSPLSGCRRLLLDLPAVHAAGAWNALNGAALAARRAQPGDKAGGDERSLPQLRADLATALLTGQATPARPAPGAPGVTGAPGVGDLGDLMVPSGAALTRFAEVHVVIAADTVTGQGPGADRPGRIPGAAAVDASTARQVAVSAPWRRLVTDSRTGVLVHRGARTVLATVGDTDQRLAQLLSEPVTDAAALTTAAYRPGERLRKHVIARDHTCIAPACQHPAEGTQFDHTIDWAPPPTAGGGTTGGGTTSHDNGGSLCQRGHNAKTHGGWHLKQPVPGAFMWTSPTGRRYDRQARPLLPDPPPQHTDPDSGVGREPP